MDRTSARLLTRSSVMRIATALGLLGLSPALCGLPRLLAVWVAEQALGKLFHEFCSVASRDEKIGARFRACFRARKQIIVRLLENEISNRGIELTFPIERLVMGIFALFTGLSVERTIDPEGIDEALFGEMLGLIAKSAVAPKP